MFFYLFRVSKTTKLNAYHYLTEWKQFRSTNFSSIIERLNGRVFFDGRNQYIPKEMRTLGFTYYGVGVEKGEPIEKVEHKRRETFAIN